MSVVTVCYVIYYVNVMFNFVTVCYINVKVCSVLLCLCYKVLYYVMCYVYVMYNVMATLCFMLFNLMLLLCYIMLCYGNMYIQCYILCYGNFMSHYGTCYAIVM